MTETIELSDLELKVLDCINETMNRKYLRKELSLTVSWMNRIFKKLKQNWLTKIHWYWWTFYERSYEWEVDYRTEVWRYTVITDKWLDLLLKLK